MYFLIILHCLHFDSKVANIYKFRHLFGNLLHVVMCQIKVHKVNFKAKNNAYFLHLQYFKSKRKDLQH